MSKILVSGLINIETTVKVEGFPINYIPVRYSFGGVNSSVSGVGYNLAKALIKLGSQVNFMSMIGKDFFGELVKLTLKKIDISNFFICENLRGTPQSVIFYDSNGKRQINVDLKDIQETFYPEELFEEALERCDILALCNINFSRPFLFNARKKEKIIATDVHAISKIDDDYNLDFMKNSNILFMSDELLPCSPEEWSRKLMDSFGNDIVVIGLGDKGALLGVREDNFIERIPAVYTRPVVNTIGAGDALFSSFLHFYRKQRDPYKAIKKAVVFASYKIGENGAANGFLDEKSFNQKFNDIIN